MLKALQILKEELEELRNRKGQVYSHIREKKGSLKEAIAELEALENKDRLAELEKVILDYYLAKGYEIGVGGWAFYLRIVSDYKSKWIQVYFKESENSYYDKILELEEEKTTKEMFDKAFEYFNLKDKK